MSPLKFVTCVPGVLGRKEKTLFAPFEPSYKFLRRQFSTKIINVWQVKTHQVCPAKETPLTVGWGWPLDMYTEEMGPAFQLASQIMISLTLAPPGLLAVNKSYATFATMFPLLDWDQLNVACLIVRGLKEKKHIHSQGWNE